MLHERLNQLSDRILAVIADCHRVANDSIRTRDEAVVTALRIGIPIEQICTTLGMSEWAVRMLADRAERSASVNSVTS